jgi:hypothetical protein
MCWKVMGSLPIIGSPPNGTLEAPLPPVRGFLFACPLRWPRFPLAALDTERHFRNLFAKRWNCVMPLDPQECRRQALACVRLAQTSITPQARRHYAELAKTWLTIAGDLADLESQQKTDPEKKTG